MKVIRESSNLSQSRFGKQIYCTQQQVWDMEHGRKSVTDETCRTVHEAFPSYRLAWIRGDDDCMTEAERSRQILAEAIIEGGMLDRGFRMMAEVAGFTIEDAVIGGEVEEVIDHIKNGMLVSRDGTESRIDIDQMNRIQNEVLNYLEFLLVKAIS